MTQTAKAFAIAWASLVLVIGAVAPRPAIAEDAPSMRIHAGITKAISPHVHVIPAQGRPGVPNVGIVVGSRAALVIESGFGEDNGKTVLEETRRIAGDIPIYVIATHFHPEHIGGEQAFPASATILRPAAQQQEIEASGGKLIELFRSLSADNALLLEGFSYRPADISFNGQMQLNLGGVVVEIIKAGPAHTDGDIALFVRDDGVLFTGDVVQQNYAPVLVGEQSTPASWLAQIDMLEKLPARIIVPSHTAVTGRAAFNDMRDTVRFLRDRWAEIKASELTGKAAEDRLVADFQARFPACGNAEFVRASIPRL